MRNIAFVLRHLLHACIYMQADESVVNKFRPIEAVMARCGFIGIMFCRVLSEAAPLVGIPSNTTALLLHFCTWCEAMKWSGCLLSTLSTTDCTASHNTHIYIMYIGFRVIYAAAHRRRWTSSFLRMLAQGEFWASMSCVTTALLHRCSLDRPFQCPLQGKRLNGGGWH